MVFHKMLATKPIRITTMRFEWLLTNNKTLKQKMIIYALKKLTNA